jgi:hypothetical protein
MVLKMRFGGLKSQFGSSTQTEGCTYWPSLFGENSYFLMSGSRFVVWDTYPVRTLHESHTKWPMQDRVWVPGTGMS